MTAQRPLTDDEITASFKEWFSEWFGALGTSHDVSADRQRRGESLDRALDFIRGREFTTAFTAEAGAGLVIAIADRFYQFVQNGTTNNTKEN